MHEALHELREEVSKKSSDVEKIERLNKALDVQESKNQELTKSIEEHKSRQEQFESTIKEMEARFSRPEFLEVKEEVQDLELKAFQKYIETGVNGLADIEKKYLRTDNNPQGGFLVVPEYSNELIKKITEISPIMSLARVFQTSTNEIIFPKRSTLVTGAWYGEGGTIASSNSTYGRERLFVHKLAVYQDATHEMLSDNAYNIASELVADVSETFAQLEGDAFINGTAANQPEGLLTNTSVPEYASGDASLLTADALIGIQGELKVGYQHTFLFNRRTLHQHIRLLKDTQDRYLFQLGNVETPNMIAGVPYVICNDMPDVGADAYPILLGDFRKGYYIANSQNVVMLRDDYTQANVGQVRFHFHRRVGGGVVLPEAMIKMKVATSV